MEAEFRCLKCGYQWKAKPGSTPCIKCGHLYVKWLNYDEMDRLIFKEERNKETEKAEKARLSVPLPPLAGLSL